MPWDAVELPSQFMENWCWEPEALAFISGHYETGEPLPKELLDKMLAAKNYQAALFILRQLEFGLFELPPARPIQPAAGCQMLETLAEIKKQVAVVPGQPGAFPMPFSHIFAGGYAASTTATCGPTCWRQMPSLALRKRDLRPSDWAVFLDNILTRGGSEEPMALFKRFRGREPQLDAMLEHYGSRLIVVVKICLIDETGAGDGALSVLAARWGWNRMTTT
ncbi:M3 family metallopeptidase [Shigella flexneri]